MSKLILLIIPIILFACSNSSDLNSDELIKWYKNTSNGFVKSKTIGDIVIEIQKKPCDYIIALENELPLDSEKYNKKHDELGDLLYYEFKIGNKSSEQNILKYGLNSPDEYKARIDYFSYKMKSDFSIDIGGIIYPCVIYHFERNYDLRSDRIITLAFEKPLGKFSKETFIYKDQVFGLGKIKLEFLSGSELQPKLKLAV